MKIHQLQPHENTGQQVFALPVWLLPISAAIPRKGCSTCRDFRNDYLIDSGELCQMYPLSPATKLKHKVYYYLILFNEQLNNKYHLFKIFHAGILQALCFKTLQQPYKVPHFLQNNINIGGS